MPRGYIMGKRLWEKMDFPFHDYSHKAMMFSCFATVLMLAVSVISWFLLGDVPLDLYKFVLIAHGICFSSYCCKQGYEFKKLCEMKNHDRRG